MKYRADLPQMQGGLFLTDGGIETTMIFKEGVDLPDFAAFDLLRREGGEELLSRYFRSYAHIAQRRRLGLILESATWRASADWGERLGYTAAELAAANRKAIRLLADIRQEVESRETPVVISGCLGPRGDGYRPSGMMSAADAQAYHLPQVAIFAESEADMVTAITMNYAAEALGIAAAARITGMPVCIAFTVETDGRLPDGQPLRHAIDEVDAATSGYPVYYMVNCAHPTHFAHIFVEGESWLNRIRGIRANASRQSHAELNDTTVLDDGDPEELGVEYAELAAKLPGLCVVGGCCGTDERHVDRMAEACAPLCGSPRPVLEPPPLPG